MVGLTWPERLALGAASGRANEVSSGRATDASAEFLALTLPTLVVRGGRSNHLSVEEADRMAARPNVKLVTIEGAGHFVHAEKPVPFCEALSTFLEEVER